MQDDGHSDEKFVLFCLFVIIVVLTGTDYKSPTPLACSDVPRGVARSNNVDTHGERLGLG